MIYLDHNATTPIDDRVLEAMLPYLATFYGNPSSLYRHGRMARSALDVAREQVAALVNAQASQIIFTSSGTEANNLALTALPANDGLAISAIEHPCITEPAQRLQTQGHALSILAVDRNGLITQDAIDQIIKSKPALVSMMLANNETGAIQLIAEYAQQLGEHNIMVHTDAVQAAGKIAVDFKQLGVQLMTLSSHKIYGPKGCGALVFDKSVPIKPLLLGGGQEQGLRAGTENVAAIVGFGKAAELAKAELTSRKAHTLKLQNQLEQGLRALPGLQIFAELAPRLPNTTQIGISGMDGEMLLMKLDQKGVAVSSGSACASGAREPSPVSLAMGIDAELALSAIRISLGKNNTESEISKFIEQLSALIPKQ